MSRLALHVLAVGVGWLLDHPFAPALCLFTFAAWAWWLSFWGASLK